MSFAQVWNEMFPPVYNRLCHADHQCNSCNLVSLCGKGAAWSLMEKGDMDARVEYGSEIGNRRAEKLGYWDGPTDPYSARRNEVLLLILKSPNPGERERLH